MTPPPASAPKVDSSSGVENARHRSLEEVIENKRVVIVCGSGGVGKTTVAAALALHGAYLGRRTAVVTIDPARRLANALGLESLEDEAAEIPRSVWDPENKSPDSGSYSAMMLDAKATFDRLVARYAADEAQIRRILSNTFYQNIAGALSGTQEYMAMEKLYELDQDGPYDLIVVDTPPSRNALDFLEAPGRLSRFLDARVFRYFLSPTRAYLKAVSSATRGVLKIVAKVIGSEVIDDAVEFFAAFEGMYDGFKDRANHVTDLLDADETAYLLVASPRREAADEAEFFAEKLVESGHPIDGLIVNRVHPRFSDLEPGVALGRAAALERGDRGADRLAILYENLANFDRVADREAGNLAGLAGKCAPAPIVLVPYMAHDVADFEGLDEISWYMFPESDGDATELGPA